MAATATATATATALLLALLLAAAVVAAQGQGQGGAGRTVKKQLQAEPEPDAPEVQLSLGWLAGRWVQTRGGRRVAAFTAVPFAKPPVAELRFKAPVPVEPWAEARESPPLQEVPVCPQHEDAVSTQGLPRSEDCLYLNVFTPSPANGSNLPVLAFLHGGAFVEGGASAYGPEYLLDDGRDAVLVSINYRLGALGFLSTGDAAASGNWGLKDQQLALRWLRQHVAALGGDPDRVTLLGQSAGAVSAHTHLAARTSRGLFQRAVSLGGSALTAGLPQSAAAARRLALKLAARVGCPAAADAPSAGLLACLRAKPAADLVAHEAFLRDDGLCPVFTWGPVVEDFVDVADQDDHPAFLEQHPVDALTSGLAYDVPWLSGINLNDGGLWAAAIQASKQVEAFDANLNTLVPLCFGFNDTAQPDDLPDIMQEIREFYFGANNVTRESLNDVANLFTDGLFLWSLDEAMRLHAAYASAPAYLYLFSHRGQRSLTDLHGEGAGRGRGGPNDLGVVHGDELLHLFPLEHVLPRGHGGQGQDAEDRKASDQLIGLLLNFASAGNPTPDGDARYRFPWKSVESEDLEFLEVGPGGRLLKGAGPLGNRAHFWAALPLSERNARNMQTSVYQPGRHDEF